MTYFFEKKLILLDVDNTLLNWSNWLTLWSLRADWKEKGKLSQTLVSLRGRRFSPKRTQPINSETASRPRIATWFIESLPWIAEQEICLAIYSDLPQLSLRTFCRENNICHIVDGIDIGCLKPLPDGIQHVQAVTGVPTHNIFVIGDGPTTDGKAAQAIGANYIPVESLQQDPVGELRKWIL